MGLCRLRGRDLPAQAGNQPQALEERFQSPLIAPKLNTLLPAFWVTKGEILV